MRSYSELIKFNTFKERYEYCRLQGEVGVATFGFDRYLNQKFYTSPEWRSLRHQVIIRDNGCDLAITNRPIYRAIRIHHLNPITIEDFQYDHNQKIFDIEFLVCVSHETHNAIHYGTEVNLPIQLVERKAGDTRLWKVY